MTFINTLGLDPDKHSGLAVIADVHGMMASMEAAVADAREKDRFILFLGDIVDYGPDSLATVDYAHDLIAAGAAISIKGNHEKKMARWFDQHEAGEEIALRVSHGNQITIDSYLALDEAGRKGFLFRFRDLLARSSMMATADSLVFAHGAVHPSYWGETFSEKKAEAYAYYGQVDRSVPASPNGYPTRIYNWVDAIPADKTVIVGHDIRSKVEPLTVHGRSGGQAIFLDTGSAKGGVLTKADYAFKDGKLAFIDFRSY